MNKLKTFLMQYPLETVLILLATAAEIIIQCNTPAKTNKILFEMFLILEISIPFVLAISIWQKKISSQFSKWNAILMQLAVLLFSSLYIIAIYPQYIKYLSDAITPRLTYEILVPIVLGFIIVIHTLYKKQLMGDTENERYINTLFYILFAIIIGLIYGLAVFIGLEIANLAIENLWGYPVWLEDINLQLILFILVFNFIAYKVASNYVNLKAPSIIIKGITLIKSFVKYLLIPLYILYTIILYPYIIKILITGKWPSNTITPLALTYAIIGFIIIMTLHSILTQNKQKIVSGLISPIILMQLYGIYIRMHAYGITVNRLELFFVGVTILLLSLYMTILPNPKFITISYAIVILTLLTPISFLISQQDQIHRYYKFLQAKGFNIKNGKVYPSPNQLTIHDDDSYKIGDYISYFYNYYGLSSFNNTLDRSTYLQLKEFIKQKQYFSFYDFHKKYLQLLNVEVQGYYTELSNEETNFPRTYDLSDIYSADLNFQFFPTPITINKLETVTYNNAYIQPQNNRWILYTETNTFLIPDAVKSYLTQDEDYYYDPKIIVLRSQDQKDEYLFIKKMTFQQKDSSQQIEVNDLEGILMYTE